MVVWSCDLQTSKVALSCHNQYYLSFNLQVIILFLWWKYFRFSSVLGGKVNKKVECDDEKSVGDSNQFKFRKWRISTSISSLWRIDTVVRLISQRISTDNKSSPNSTNVAHCTHFISTSTTDNDVIIVFSNF